MARATSCELDQTSFFAQGQEYLDAADIRDSVLKILLNERAAHPYAVVRAAELRRWVDSGEYTQILAGTYPRRDEDGGASMSEAAKQAADSYTEAFRTSQDALGQAGPRRGRASSAAPSSGSTSSCAAPATEQTGYGAGRLGGAAAHEERRRVRRRRRPHPVRCPGTGRGHSPWWSARQRLRRGIRAGAPARKPLTLRKQPWPSPSVARPVMSPASYSPRK